MAQRSSATFLALIAIAAAATVPPAGSALFLAGLETVAVGVLTQGESDTTRGLFDVCATVLRPALVTVSFKPSSASDLVSVRVHLAGGPREGLLTAAQPVFRVEGDAPTTCMVQVTLRGDSVESAAPYVVTDARV